MWEATALQTEPHQVLLSYLIVHSMMATVWLKCFYLTYVGMCTVVVAKPGSNPAIGMFT